MYFAKKIFSMVTKTLVNPAQSFLSFPKNPWTLQWNGEFEPI